jgi:hypothetical protein
MTFLYIPFNGYEFYFFVLFMLAFNDLNFLIYAM